MSNKEKEELLYRRDSGNNPDNPDNPDKIGASLAGGAVVSGPRPLNPALYQGLKRAFRYVRISNEGEQMVACHMPNWSPRGGVRSRLTIVTWGETYNVNCPFCNDTRLRLSINHRWASFDPKSNSHLLELATCYNEGCLSTLARQKQLHTKVYPLGQHSREQRFPEQPLEPAPSSRPREITLPPTIPLDQLPPDHAALKYLRERGFDPAQLAQDWGVAFCTVNTDTDPRFLDPRLVIPIFRPPLIIPAQATDAIPRLAGWQARAIEAQGEESLPKYLTAAGMQKSKLLYGLASHLGNAASVASNDRI